MNWPVALLVGYGIGFLHWLVSQRAVQKFAEKWKRNRQ